MPLFHFLLRSLPSLPVRSGCLAELDGGVIEAAQASGATFWDIVGVYLSEGLPDLIRVTTVTLISLVGETAMAEQLVLVASVTWPLPMDLTVTITM